ncbi:MAG: flagellar hook-length control protein FliK, partial [Christensenellales bacterium]
NPTNELFQQTLLNIDSTLESATDISKLKNTDLFKNIPTINENAPINETTEISDTAEASKVSESAGNADDLSENTVTPNNTSPDSKIGFAAKFLHNITESAKNSINSMLQQSSQNADNPQSSATNTVIDTLCEKFQTLGRENDYLSTFLDKDARTELLNTLSKLPISRSLIVKIVSGNASAKEVLTVIKNVIPLSEPELISELFKSQSFEALFSKVLQSTWTLSPQKLKDGENINSFYNKMHEQLKDFESLIKSNLSGQDSDNLGQNARDAQSNIEFMKTLSEAFSYFQMPLKLKNQDAHGDLYVYTKKEKLRKNLDNIHVLLHLDMENLGALDVYLDKNHNEITTKFISDNDKSIDLLATNADMLKDALNSQGYACHVKIEKADASTSTIDEFINTKINTQQTTEMKRFSFDIRA